MIRLVKFFLVVFLLTSVVPACADKFKVLYANSSKIVIGNKMAVKGLVFDDINQIQWTSNDQALKLLNLTTNRVIVIPAVVYKKNWAESLYDLLVKVKRMSTSGYEQFDFKADTICYILDTLKVDAGYYYGNSTTNKAVLITNKDTIVTNLQKTNDKRELILTRKIFGEKKERAAYIDIIETDTYKNWTYHIYRNLRIELLPMNADKQE